MNTLRELYLLRHAEAVDIGTNGVTHDGERMLTEKGARQARAMGAVLRRLDNPPAIVWASPHVRAWETAERVMRELGLKGAPAAIEALLPEARPEELWRAIQAHDEHAPILLVGHLPSIAHFAEWLLGGVEGALHFRKASLARLDVLSRPAAARPHATLSWLLPVSLAKTLTAASHRA